MSYLSVSRIMEMGRRVDPIILEALSASSPPDFLSSLKYHFEAGGKRMRAALVMISCASAGGKIQDALRPAAVVEMIHNYSLVMDDLIDRGEVRRGKPTVRVVAGDSVSLLIAMYYREILDQIIQSCVRSTRIREIAVRAMKDIVDGETLDLLFEQAGRDEPYLESNRITDPSFRQYLEMIGKKTAALFRAASEIGGHAAKARPRVVDSLSEFGWKAGLAFQIMDDVLDICGSNTGKQVGKDVIEHKLGNSAILVAMRYLTDRKKAELLKILRSKRVPLQMARRARTLVAQTPAEIECREIAKAYLDGAKQQLSILKDSEYKRSLMVLSDLVVSRRF